MRWGVVTDMRLLAVLVAIVATGCAAAPDDRGDDAAVLRSPPPTTAPPGSLDARYEACAVAAGFDPGGVQVLVGASGTPEWVKTGRDVPTRVHRPCFRLIGGADVHRSSHGNS